MPDPKIPRRRAWRFWRPDVAAEVDEELGFHLAARAAEYEARGETAADAMRVARRRFGDVDAVRRRVIAHDEARERRHQRREHMAHLARDARLAFRGFRRAPA